jgi:hypothetical protein
MDASNFELLPRVLQSNLNSVRWVNRDKAVGLELRKCSVDGTFFNTAEPIGTIVATTDQILVAKSISGLLRHRARAGENISARLRPWEIEVSSPPYPSLLISLS